jgi:hypothetical protein
MFGTAKAQRKRVSPPFTCSGGKPRADPADRDPVSRSPGERRVGERIVLGSRPQVRLRHNRRGLVGRRWDVAVGNLVQVSVTGALVVTAIPLQGVEVGTIVEIELQERRTTAIVRRAVVHHDMTLYGLELVDIDRWFQALIDRAITEARADARAASSTTR